jgi:hypothetical protein
MKIKEYLKKNGIQTGWFAGQIPCSVTYLCTIVSGTCIPSLTIRRRIHTLTAGQVTEHEYELERKRRYSR